MPSSGVQKCALDRKSTRLNSSHGSISYAVFCLKKTNILDPMLSPATPRSHSHPLHSHEAPVQRGQRASVLPQAPGGIVKAALLFFFFLRIRRPPKSTLFPSPPLSRSLGVAEPRGRALLRGRRVSLEIERGEL